MKRRDVLIGGPLALAAFSVFAVPSQALPVAGAHYFEIRKPVNVAGVAAKRPLFYFFSLRCVHCSSLFEAHLRLKAKLPKDVEVIPVHVDFGSEHQAFQRFYYAAMELKASDAVIGKVYSLVHGASARRVKDKASAVALAAEVGLDAKKFEAAYDGFVVAGKLSWANSLVQGFGVDGTPSYAVGVKYFVPGQGPGTTDVVQYLINR